jgi:hypothetical protein
MLALAALCLVALVVLLGRTLTSLQRRQLATVPTIALLTPSATATPVLWRGAPHQLPAGWSAYYAPHFTIALPSGWQVTPVVMQKDPDPRKWHMRYALYPPAEPPSAPDARILVEEWDDLSAARVRDEFCAPTASYEARTIAGLPMRFLQVGPIGAATLSSYERDWTYISDQGTVYKLVALDDIGNDVNRVTENRAIVETFAPQYATWGCV